MHTWFWATYRKTPIGPKLVMSRLVMFGITCMLFRKDHLASTLPPLMVMLKHSDEDGISHLNPFEVVLTVINNGQS